MKREISIERLVYEQMIGSAAGLPGTLAWPAFVREHLVPEIKAHVAKFYGQPEDSDSYEEATYPGLDYAYFPHRRRLSFYPWHEQLFEAFDELGLTDSEIRGLCTWNGTLHHRQRYERANKTRVRDQTLDWIPTETNREVRERLEREKRKQSRQEQTSLPRSSSETVRVQATEASEPTAEAGTEGDVDDENKDTSSGASPDRESIRRSLQQAPPRPRNPTASARNSHVGVNLPYLPSLLLSQNSRRVSVPPAIVAHAAPTPSGVSIATQTSSRSTQSSAARA